MLCAKCIFMFQNVSKTREGDHHETVDDLIKAAQSGCRICIHENMKREKSGPGKNHAISIKPFLRYHFIARGRDDDTAFWEIYFKSGMTWTDPANHIIVHVEMATVIPAPLNYGKWLESVKADLKREPWRVRREDFYTREIASNTGADSSMKVAKNWLHECKENHKSCHDFYGNAAPGWYPKILVDVGEYESMIQLVVPTQDHITGVYAALSHSWGRNSSFLTLTSENFELFRKNIPVSLIPKSFRDAIKACRSLDIKYLWIDSLCILQSGKGSNEDWLYHATEMSKIYLNCVLNLTIVHASCPHDGAFVERNPDFLQDCYLWCPLPYPNSDDRSLGKDWYPGNLFVNKLSCDELSESNSVRLWKWLGQKPKSYWERFLATFNISEKQPKPEELRMCMIFASDMDFRSSRISQPLSTRGWALQERLLSPRVLHFQRDRIAWECQEAALSEYFPSRAPCGCDFDVCFKPSFNLPQTIFEQQKLVETEPEGKSRTRPMQSRYVNSQFWNLVEEYSRRDLSFPTKDKLVAFSAIARYFGSAFGDEYFMGIFRSDIPEGLLWSGFQTRRQDQWRAPTWSWASVDGRVMPSKVELMIEDGIMEVLANLEDIQMELVDPSNRYGQAKSGRLVMRSLVLPWREELHKGEESENGREEVRRFATEINYNQVKDQEKIISIENKTGSTYAEDHRQALDSSTEIISLQESNRKIFEKKIINTSYDQIRGYHGGFQANLSITLDGEGVQDDANLDKCFLLPIFEQIPGTKSIERKIEEYSYTNKSWGLVLLRQDDRSYTRLGVFESPDKCLGRQAIENGMKQQIITIV